MIDSNDRLIKENQTRNRRRKNAAWKSGLMLTGLGAVIAGAGYLAGVNAPAVAQTTASTVAATTGAASLNNSDNQLASPNNDLSANGFNSDEARGFEFNSDDDQPAVGNSGTSPSLGNDGSNSSGQSTQQFGGRRGRQFRGFGQQQPGFGQPLTRSLGS